MLKPYRVLDLTDERGLLCGQMLADLGADVIAIEPPGGSTARRRGPFAGDIEGLERSLWWWAYSRNKRSVVLDLDTTEGRETLKRLAVTADILIESGDPGAMAYRGLGYTDLAAINPRLVYVSITPFGQDGPRAADAATDLTVLAASGPLALTGDDDRPPVRLVIPQAFLHASAEGAVGALLALHERERSGLGQHVDVSAQQAAAQATQSLILSAKIGENQPTRMGGGVKLGPLNVQLLWPAKDGYVAITFLFGSAVGPFTRRLMEWVYEEGFCDEASRDKDWLAYTELLLSGKEPIEEYERLKRVLGEFTATKTKGELLQGALERGLLIAPATTMRDVVEAEQLREREYWRTHDYEGVDRPVRHPGPFARFSATPIVYKRRAPLIGEHTDEVLASLPAAAPARVGGGSNGQRGLPLEGVKIVDLMWVMAGPAAIRVFADYGATVIRIESTKRVDTARTIQPFHNATPGPENSGLFQNMNAGKLGITLDLSTDAGRGVFFDLVRWADVVTESFAPGAMQAWGLDYESLRRANPRLIMLSSCLMGQSGPLARFAGFGNLAAAISGFFNVAGWPDRPPAGPFGAYSDYVAPRFTAAAILAALSHRRRTGEGQYIDQSQAEAALHFLAPAILDYTVNDRVMLRDGNRDPHMAPHSVYPCRGEDRWVAVAARTDADWAALCQVIGRPELATDSRFATLPARAAAESEIDAIIAAWTAERDMVEAEQRFQAHGVPAHAVRNSTELAEDPQLQHRGHFIELEHPVHGSTWVEGSRFRLSATPARTTTCGPTFGRDTWHVLENILRYDAERIAKIAAAGALD